MKFIFRLAKIKLKSNLNSHKLSLPILITVWGWDGKGQSGTDG
jgi:hypothetical protein